MLEILVVPACFLGAGLIGYRLGTPARVAGGLVAVGCAHLLAFLGSDQALAAGDPAAAWIHLASQCLFLGGFVALVWLAAVYPEGRPATALMATAVALALGGPLLAATSGPTPAVLDGTRDLGPIVHALPRDAGDLGAACVILLPLMAVITFVVRYRRADTEDRASMRWPIAGLALIVALVVAGLLLGPGRQGVVTALFLLGAPIFPLALAFGPVARHQQALSSELVEVRERLARLARPQPRPGVLERLSPREMSVLRGMADGLANPVIARSMHLSLSSVEKHATSIFRKLEIPEGPEVHRRVAAVVAYRDALDGSRG